MNLTVDELITEVRDQLDEANILNVTDDQILAALNRGQRKGTNILSRRCKDLLMVSDSSTSTTAGTREYDIPTNAYGKRMDKVEIVESSGIAWEVRRIALHDTTNYNTSSQVTRPYYYALKKNSFLLYPTPSGGLTVRIWYMDEPEKLVKSQGRITVVTDSTTDSVVVDSLGDDITTDTTDSFNAYVNVIDYTTGDIKGSLQISAINTTSKTITLKSSGLTRSTVLGRTIATTLPTDIAVDDYICVITGTCVPEIPGAYTDYLTQFAVTEIKRRLGEPTQEELQALKDLELELEKAWVGRESSNRVRKSSTHWQRGLGSSIRKLLS